MTIRRETLIDPQRQSRFRALHGISESEESIMDFVTDKETTGLIAASKVTGTNVYSPSAEQIGSVHDFMVDKRSGTTSYVVISFGGFLGMGSEFYPVPWKKLRYDTRLAGYVTDVTPAQLEKAPGYAEDEDPEWNDEYEKRLHDYYGLGPTPGGMVPGPNM
jgi:sporulation protein YlmC with PRC-barrel domain